MVATLMVIAASLVTAPVVAVVMVSAAILREASAWSLAGHAPGPVRAAARIVGFYCEGIVWPQPRS
jgi:hypothetical protein